MAKKTKHTETKTKKLAEAPKEKTGECADKKCHIHGGLKTRGRIFEGRVVKKLHRRVAIELERMVYIRKFERYAKSKIKIHAHLPECMESEIHVGDLIKVQECRPLSKIIHFAVIKKTKDKEEK